MSFRFWRRIKIAPGLTLNLSKSGGSLSLGPRGAKVTVGPRGKRATVGLPGTGLFYTKTLNNTGSGARASSRRRRRGGAVPPEVLAEQTADRLTLGFFQRLVTPAEEKALVNGCRELALGHEQQARAHLRRAVHLADGAYLAGFLALKCGQLAEANEFLNQAVAEQRQLGQHLAKYGIFATLSLPITDEISAYVRPDLRGVLLGLVEVHQRRHQLPEAISVLEKLRCLEPADVVVRLSLAELWLAAPVVPKVTCQRVVRLSEGIANETAVHAALMLYRAKALRRLGLATAARTTLTAALRRRKDRSAELLHALRYERAGAYEDLGQKSRARADLERLYAEDSGYRDVAVRLGCRED